MLEEIREVHLNVPDVADQRQEEQIEQLYLAIRQLSEVERAIMMLYLEEIPYEEIAEAVGITANNVRVRMNRIREKLKKWMNGNR